MRALPLPTRLTLAVIVLIGLALRLWSARGGLWVDEAWSVVLVARTRTPLDLFLHVNHDNNHHLNSLWLQPWGIAAPPLALRALSIASGTATIPLAAAFALRHGREQALVAAALFAVSPILVLYGGEARGYAPMLFFAVAMLVMVGRRLDAADPAGAPDSRALSPLALGLVVALGMTAQLTMVFFVAAAVGWIGATLAMRMPVRAAAAATTRLALPMVAAAVLVVALVVAAAQASPTGMQVGSYVPFSGAAFVRALGMMLTSTTGLSGWPDGVVAGVALAILMLAVLGWRRRDAMFGLAALIAFPLAFAMLRIGNAAMPRYFLVCSVAILLLLADRIGTVLAWDGARRGTRMAAAAVLAVLVLLSLREDLAQAALRRGDPGAAIATMARLAPHGATVTVEHPRPVATLRVAAAQARYPLRIVTGCPAARFLHVDLVADAPARTIERRCGQRYRLLVARRRAMLSGVDWALYGRIDAPGAAAYRQAD